MSVSREYLERCAVESGFAAGALEKVVRLGEIAADVARHPLLGPSLALKGGTALNLCFDAPARLSVDLDFNYVGQAERKAMLADRPRVEAALEDLARRRRYRVQRSADAFAGRKLYLGFDSALGHPERIEIDLNFVFRSPLAGTEGRALWQPGELDPPEVRVVSLEELCAGKILALLDRAAARDAWDVARLPRIASEALGSRSFRLRFLALSAVLDRPLTAYGRDRVTDRVTPRAVREELLPMLIRGREVGAGELVDDAWRVVEPLLRLDAGEAEFVEAIQHGRFRGELLLDALGPDEVEVLERHPAVQWKLRNARRHAGREGGT